MTPAEFHYDGITVRGVTLAGEETYVVVPEMNVGFDVGRCQRDLLSIDHVFLSHGHMDHAAGVAYYFSQREFVDNDPGHLYVPELLVEPLRTLMRVWADIDGHVPASNIQAAAPGQDIEVRRNLIVRPFAVNHPCRRHDRTVVQALGYAAIEVRQKLKQEFLDRTGPQIVELKKQGVQITNRVEMPLVTYCGDTTAGGFLDHEFVRDAKILLLECTFVDPDHRERARVGNHMHLDQLREIIPKLRNERILLTHLTRRTMLSDAKALLREAIGEKQAERVSFLMEHRRRRGRPRPVPTPE
ncbi:MAG: MBL fold metallo-hydrolase [Planctomycetes bacterium]|nr:MBL fold metallo-hydrolase [Planctomycetota bacterium]